MLDRYIVGDVKRISPEAPVPVVHVKNMFSTLGGVGNVARNLRSIGANVRVIAAVGIDDEGDHISGMLSGIGAQQRMIDELPTTIIKERIIADYRKVQMLRIDWEDTTPLPPELVIEILKENYEEGFYDCIVISDYAKGVISNKLMKYLNKLNIPIIVDPKPSNEVKYGRVLMTTPNRAECIQMGGPQKIGSEFVLETKGKEGMTLYDLRQGIGKVEIPAEEVEVYNVSGAGDTVLAVVSVCLAMGLDPLRSAKIANKCAGYVVTKPGGSSIITENKFIEFMQEYC